METRMLYSRIWVRKVVIMAGGVDPNINNWNGRWGWKDYSDSVYSVILF